MMPIYNVSTINVRKITNYSTVSFKGQEGQLVYIEDNYINYAHSYPPPIPQCPSG